MGAGNTDVKQQFNDYVVVFCLYILVLLIVVLVAGSWCCCHLCRKLTSTNSCAAVDLPLICQVASSVGVRQFVVPGSTVEDSRGALDLAQRKPNVCTAVTSSLRIYTYFDTSFRICVVLLPPPTGAA